MDNPRTTQIEGTTTGLGALLQGGSATTGHPGQSVVSGCGQAVVGLLIALVGVTVFCAVGLPQVRLFLASAKWERAEGWVQDFEFREEPLGGEATTTDAYCRYTYRLDGLTYEGTRVSPPEVGLFGSTDGYFRNGETLRRHSRSGAPLPVWVDPENPSESLLFREVDQDLLRFLLVFCLFWIGAGMLMGGQGIVAVLGRRWDPARFEAVREWALASSLLVMLGPTALFLPAAPWVVKPLLALFPLAALLALVATARETLRYWRDPARR